MWEEDFDLVSDGGVTLQSDSAKVRTRRSKLETNFALGTIGKDSLKGCFDRSKFLHGLVHGTTTNVDTLRGCALAASLRNWCMLKQHRQCKPSGTYPSMVWLAQSPP